MATIPEAYLRAVSDAINALSENARALALARLNEVVEEVGSDNPFALVEAVAEAVEPYVEALAEGAAGVSANSYDVVRMASIGEAMGAQPYPSRDPEWTKQALYGIAKDHQHNIGAFIQGVLDRMDYEARRAAGKTTYENGARDPEKPRFARVPTGAETCRRCIMYASRGFVYLSEESAGKYDPDHYHKNCDCRVVQGYPGTEVEGYDPDALLKLWVEMEEEGIDHVGEESSH